MKFWNKWLRKTHRWVAIPMFILIPISIVLKVSGNGSFLSTFPQWEAIQSLVMLYLVISGAYLFYLPYWTKRKRNKRRSNGVKTTQTTKLKETAV